MRFSRLSWSVAAVAHALLNPPALAADLAPARESVHSATFANSTEPGTLLTLEAALRLALSANPELAVAVRELEAAEGPVIQGRALPNPHLQTLLEDTRPETRTTTVQISQLIELGGKRAARIDAAERGRDIAAAELAARRAEIRALVSSAFFDLLVAQERIRLADAAVALARRAADAAAKRVIAGKVSPVEETRARVAEAGARIDAAQAGSEVRAARQRLAALWGSSAPRFAQASGDMDSLPAVPSAEALGARMQEAPALARARIEVQRRKALSDLERARRVPDVTVSFGTKRVAELGRDQAMFGVSIPLPIFDTNRGNLREALGREDKARDELTAVQTRLTLEAMLARERLGAAREEAGALLREVLPNAQSAYDAATRGFELGRFNFTDVLDAQRTLFQAKAQALSAVAEAHRAAADIDRLTGAARQ